MDSCPDRPHGTRPADLGFRPRRMVRWLDPGPLVTKELKAAISGQFGSHADRREMEAALTHPDEHDYSDQPEMWFDYAADTGDGFASTLTVASLLAAESLALEGSDRSTRSERGRFLVLGGDEVYPAANEGLYQDRFLGPFRAALPCVPEGEPPDVYAIPGNHDWYDGLRSFLRIFCQGRWVGGWRTSQARSYFALKLPHRWWLWAIDISFDRDIDQPQLEYFRALARTRLHPGDRIILCTAKPSWVHAGMAGDEKAKAGLKHVSNLEYFERSVLAGSGTRVMLHLSGDLHHYARYSNGDGSRHMITSGGGGAYLYPTHNLPQRISWPGPDSNDSFELRTAFPSRARSRALRPGVLLSPIRNPGFCAFAGAVYVVMALMIVFSLRATGAGTFERALHGASFQDLLFAMLRYPASLLLGLGVLGAYIKFADGKTLPGRLAMGLTHGLIQLALPLLILWAASRLALSGAAFMAAVLGIVAVGGGLAAGCVMGGYLFVSNAVLARHPNEAFAAQHIPHYKNFLRLRIGPDGSLTVFAIGIDRTVRRWNLKEGQPQDPWLEPGATIRASLIDEEVRIP